IVIYILSGGEWFDFAQYQQNMQAAMAGNAKLALTNQPQMSMKWELLFEFSIIIISIIFWRKWRGATPGKKYLKIKIVDASTLKDIDNKQAVTRSLAYIVSTLAFLIGFFMVGIRKDKRALHDLIAGTSVIQE
ncbi:MAG: RDD family protein, partial [Thiovulaceae bacterium]|nr:RDD family protein [Sulfurimonadaceae bacterium]